MLLSITIAITITLAIAIILAVFTITIIIAVLLFLKIQAVNGDTEVRQFVVFHKLIDQSKLCLTGIIGTAYVYRQISGTPYQQGISYHTHGGRIQNHIVKISLQRFGTSRRERWPICCVRT